ncbi:MAG: BolA family protein [Hellea sp.]
MGIIASSIKEKLEQSFSPMQLDVIDESYKHAHHRGAHEHAAEGGSAESHFHVVIVSHKFEGMSVLAKHRAVKEAISEEMTQIHALSIEARIN